jgi:SAM-dependent methyltransferase
MDHEEVGRFWNANADAWTKLARAGYDIYRDYLNTPAFFAILPDVNGLAGLDIGCGEGHNTRLLAKRGARMTAIDIAQVFIDYAKQAEEDEPLGIDYRVASAVNLPFAEAAFDFATGFMSFMDIPETRRVLAEAYRVLRPGGFLQFRDFRVDLRGGAAAGDTGAATVQDSAVHTDGKPMAESADRCRLCDRACRGAVSRRLLSPYLPQYTRRPNRGLFPSYPCAETGAIHEVPGQCGEPGAGAIRVMS